MCINLGKVGNRIVIIIQGKLIALREFNGSEVFQKHHVLFHCKYPFCQKFTFWDVHSEHLFS